MPGDAVVVSAATTRSVLQAARALVAAGWRQNGLAADASGLTVRYESEEAVAFCALGATLRAGHDLANMPAADAARYALGAVARRRLQAEDRRHGAPLTDFNDVLGRTRAEVLSLFDEALGAEVIR